MNYLKEIITSGSKSSSAIFINISGALLGFVLLIADTVMGGALNATNYGIYLAYCAGVYATSKTLNVIDNKNNKIEAE